MMGLEEDHVSPMGQGLGQNSAVVKAQVLESAKPAMAFRLLHLVRNPGK